MTDRIRITTRLPRTQVARLLHSLPGRITSRISDPEQISRVWHGHFARLIFKQIHDDFMLKSRGLPDSNSVRWPPLAPSTVARKLRTGGGLSSSQKKRWQRTFNSTLSAASGHMKRRQAVIKAREAAWQAVGSAAGGTSVPIGIDSGTLEKSLRPGTATSNGYVPRPKQQYTVRSSRFVLGSRVPYARHFARRRAIFPDRSGPLVARSAARATARALRSFLRRST